LSDYPGEKLLKARAVIETGALYYTMKAMANDPSYILACGRWPIRRRPPTDWTTVGSRTTLPSTGVGRRQRHSRRWASFCDLLQAFFHKFRDRHGDGDFCGGRDGHGQIVEFLRAKELDKPSTCSVAI